MNVNGILPSPCAIPVALCHFHLLFFSAGINCQRHWNNNQYIEYNMPLTLLQGE